MTQIDTTAATLIALVKTALTDPAVDRSAITTAAVALMDATARSTDDDDEILIDLADSLAEQAALWAYFRRPNDDLLLRNALRAYVMAATAIAADIDRR